MLQRAPLLLKGRLALRTCWLLEPSLLCKLNSMTVLVSSWSAAPGTDELRVPPIPGHALTCNSFGCHCGVESVDILVLHVTVHAARTASGKFVLYRRAEGELHPNQTCEHALAGLLSAVSERQTWLS